MLEKFYTIDKHIIGYTTGDDARDYLKELVGMCDRLDEYHGAIGEYARDLETLATLVDCDEALRIGDRDALSNQLDEAVSGLCELGKSCEGVRLRVNDALQTLMHLPLPESE